MSFRYILGIETSCDETAVGIFDSLEKKILANILFSQINLHIPFGGVMPEISSRSHLEKIGLILTQALEMSKIQLADIGAIGVTTHPGLFGSLLVGVCFAKGIAYSNKIPIWGINHNHGHIVSSLLSKENFLREDVSYPFLCLSVSGGHTSMFLVKTPTIFELLGETLDDAAGEAFDKVAKMLNLSYPGGPIIEKLSASVENKDFFNYPRNKNIKDLNFSFSGLKTAVLYDLTKKGVYDKKLIFKPENLTPEIQAQVASSFQCAVTETLEKKIKIAVKLFPKIQNVVLVGGVSCNKFVVQRLSTTCKKLNKNFFSPPLSFCTDNGAMIALATYFEIINNKKPTPFSELDIQR